MFSRHRLSVRGTAGLAIHIVPSSRVRLNNTDGSEERGNRAAEHRNCSGRQAIEVPGGGRQKDRDCVSLRTNQTNAIAARYSRARRSNCALTATITVLADIRIAAKAGVESPDVVEIREAGGVDSVEGHRAS
jgi:hypothetical protein